MKIEKNISLEITCYNNLNFLALQELTNSTLKIKIRILGSKIIEVSDIPQSFQGFIIDFINKRNKVAHIIIRIN